MPIPYEKNKMEAFQAVQQAVAEARHATENIIKHHPDEGALKKQAMKEIMEAEVQINKALTVSSDRQHDQLDQYQDEIIELKEQIQLE